jgi:protease YdgD
MACIAIPDSGRAAGRIGIQGKDDRLAVEVEAYPWNSIGRLNNNGRGFCTAVLIAPDRVLTAAHCVRSLVPGNAWALPRTLHFLAGYRRGQYVAHSAAVAISVAPAEPGTAPRNSDFAVVTLAQPITAQILPLAVEDFDPDRWAADCKAGVEYAQAGYSADRSHILTRNAACAITGFLNGSAVFAHTCDATHGDSGSPILVQRGKVYTVVGLHVASSRKGATEWPSLAIQLWQAWHG